MLITIKMQKTSEQKERDNMTLEIENLHVKAFNKIIIDNLDFNVEPGTVHAIMGKNGSGKSTLLHSIMGRDDLKITAKKISYNKEDIQEMDIDERVGKGIFLAHQSPVEIPGVITSYYLKTMVNSLRKKRNKEEYDTPEFARIMRETAQKVGVTRDMLKRPINSGFSGGEKKRLELLQLLLSDSNLILIDEIDSGLDVDGCKMVHGVLNDYRNKNPKTSFVFVVHWSKLIEPFDDAQVHLLNNGKIAKSGDINLAKEIENKGYNNDI